MAGSVQLVRQQGCRDPVPRPRGTGSLLPRGTRRRPAPPGRHHEPGRCAGSGSPSSTNLPACPRSRRTPGVRPSWNSSTWTGLSDPPHDDARQVNGARARSDRLARGVRITRARGIRPRRCYRRGHVRKRRSSWRDTQATGGVRAAPRRRCRSLPRRMPVPRPGRVPRRRYGTRGTPRRWSACRSRIPACPAAPNPMTSPKSITRVPPSAPSTAS